LKESQGMKQKTVRKEFVISGVGLHTGCKANLRILPAVENAGITFVRVDIPNKINIKVCPSNIVDDNEGYRCASVGVGGVIIHTVEHFMAVLCGLGITNLIVEIDSDEIPGLDGSGRDFLDAFKNAGIQEQDSQALVYEVKEPIGVSENGASIYITPSSEYRVSYTLDYNHPLLKSQFISAAVDGVNFEKEIAPSRTFCLESEADALREKGQGKGANFQNTLVVGKNGVKDNKVRFDDEFARHKVLDFIGDLYLLGMPIRGHVFAVKSGHNLNLKLLKKICKQKQKYASKATIPSLQITGNREIDISGIMDVLPHRYPFLLVDRVIEIEQGKKAIGIKNVSINDGFFRGHFPTRPVMPGVLMVEAMAQTAGVIALTKEGQRGKLPFFVGVDNVRFRRVVSPGDQLVMEVEIIKDSSRMAQAKGKARVGDKLVAEAEMMFTYTDSGYLAS